MKLSFNEDGDIRISPNGALKDSSDAEVEMGKFVSFLNIKKGTYKYSPVFGNLVYLLTGLISTPHTINQLKNIMEDGIRSSGIFESIFNVGTYFLSQGSVGVSVRSNTMDASWEVDQFAGLGAVLSNFNDSASVLDDSRPIVEEIFTADGATVIFNIDSLITRSKKANKITVMDNLSFVYDVLIKDVDASDYRTLRKEEYSILTSLNKRELVFLRAPATGGTIKIKTWLKKSAQYEAISNPYLLRKSSPTLDSY